jgi:hypothetical protein
MYIPDGFRTKAGRYGRGQKIMVLGCAIESYGDGTGQVKKAGGIDPPETDRWRNVNSTR